MNYIKQYNKCGINFCSLLSAFSFEKDFLEIYYNYENAEISFGYYGLPFDEGHYFIDIIIGIKI